MSEAPHLLTEDQDGILIVTLNRPDKLNALSGETMVLFEQALHRFRDTPEPEGDAGTGIGAVFLRRGGSERQWPEQPGPAERLRHPRKPPARAPRHAPHL